MKKQLLGSLILLAAAGISFAGDAAAFVDLGLSADGKTYVFVNDYQKLRQVFAHLLAEVQRIKSEGDFLAARELVETYGVKVDAELHCEILKRYKTLNIAPYKGFLNPWLKIIYTDNGEVKDVVADYTETYEQQMLRYSHEYGLL